MEIIFPYELHSHGGGGFVTFEVGESVALPLIALNSATLRGPSESQTIVLAFTSHLVEIQGAGLDEVFDHLLGGVVRVIRQGHHEKCVVEKVYVRAC
jgi:hypothetical protein